MRHFDDVETYTDDVMIDEMMVELEVEKMQRREKAEKALHSLVRDLQAVLADHDLEIEKRWLKKYGRAVDELVAMANDY